MASVPTAVIEATAKSAVTTELRSSTRSSALSQTPSVSSISSISTTETMAKTTTTTEASDSTVNNNSVIAIIVGVLVIVIVATLLVVFLVIILCFMQRRLKGAHSSKNSTERNRKFIRSYVTPHTVCDGVPVSAVLNTTCRYHVICENFFIGLI